MRKLTAENHAQSFRCCRRCLAERPPELSPIRNSARIRVRVCARRQRVAATATQDRLRASLEDCRTDVASMAQR
eukprot:6214340-Pleurochrysis_carterae.AAC.4